MDTFADLGGLAAQTYKNKKKGSRANFKRSCI